MKDLWRLARPFVARRDIPFERAFHRYGGARSWIADRLAFPWDATVLELGYGQGLFTIELASRVSKGRVVGIDMLAGRSTSDLTRSFARRAGVGRRIALLQCDAFHQPFRSGAFDVVASFLALGDIAMSTGSRRFPALACELGRIARPGCRVGLADECFPESRPEGAQGRLFDAMRHHWRNRLPPRRAPSLHPRGSPVRRRHGAHVRPPRVPAARTCGAGTPPGGGVGEAAGRPGRFPAVLAGGARHRHDGGSQVPEDRPRHGHEGGLGRAIESTRPSPKGGAVPG